MTMVFVLLQTGRGPRSLRTFAILSLLGTLAMAPVWAEENVLPGLDSVRVLLDRPVSYPGPWAEIRVQAAREAHLGDTWVFDCVSDLRDAHDGCALTLEVVDAEGNSLHQGAIHFDAVKGENPARFIWLPAGLATGRHPVRITLSHDPSGVLARYELEVAVLSETDLLNRHEYVRAEAALLSAHLEAQSPGTQLQTQASARLAIASDALPDAGAMISSGEWLSAEKHLDYLVHLVDTVRASLTFGGDDALAILDLTARGEPGPAAGGFAAGGQPVFLVGAPVSSATDPEKMARHGMNLAMVDYGPNSDPEEGALVASAAAGAGLSVLARLLPGQDILPSDGWNLLQGVPVSGPNLGEASTQQTFRGHVQSATNTLPHSGTLVITDMVDGMRFQYRDDAIRMRFARHLDATYGSIDTLNESWRSRLTDFYEVQLTQDRPVTWEDEAPQYLQKPSYQYDWRSFHQAAAADWTRDTIQHFRAGLPRHTVLGATLPDSAFFPGQGWNGVSREALAGLLEAVGCTSPEAHLARDPGATYPLEFADLDLLRSINPDVPLYLPAMPLDPFDDDPVHSGSVLYSRIIHAVATGADALAVSGAPESVSTPWTTDALAMARYDLNRLAPVFRSIQEAPFQVGIVWSESSRLFQDGTPYLESALSAYEGVSYFGLNFRFVTESQMANGALDTLSVLVLPETLSLTGAAFHALQEYVGMGGVIIRGGRPAPYDERGLSRRDVLDHSLKTFLIRGSGTATDYLDALDAAWHETGQGAGLRPVNAHDYPLEKILCRTTEFDGAEFVYLLSLRGDPEHVSMAGGPRSGLDLFTGRPVEFPIVLEPYCPMLVQLDTPGEKPISVQTEDPGLPTAEVFPVPGLQPPPPRPFKVPERRRGIRPHYPPAYGPTPVEPPQAPRLYE
jgi:hypothetical protein